MSESKCTADGTLSQSDYEALARLRRALRRFTDFSAAAAHAAGLPPQQHQALLAIKGSPASETMTVGTLAAQLLITAHAATELVDRLAMSRLVVRKTDPQDRRRLILVLTPRAEKILRSLSMIHLQEIRDTAPALTEILKTLNGNSAAQG